jgi:AcrR family transcriptional regulator
VVQESFLTGFVMSETLEKAPEQAAIDRCENQACRFVGGALPKPLLELAVKSSRIKKLSETRGQPSTETPGQAWQSSPEWRAPPKRTKPKPKLRRAEKVEENLRALFRAAAKVVGDVGYTAASIASITQAAGLAQGTFYRYFDSRQDLFDQLLPHVGEDLVEFLSKRVTGAEDIYEVESKALRASFDYLLDNPGFYRILNEAEFAAPKAYESHFRNLVKRFQASLERSRRNGQLRGYRPEELETLAYMLMAIRGYIHYRYGKASTGENVPIPEAVIKTFLKFLRGGLNGA